MGVLSHVNEQFETLFEMEIFHSSAQMHVHVLAVFIDVFGSSFSGREMWEMCDASVTKCLAVLACFFREYLGDERRMEAASRLLYQLTVSETFIDCGLQQVDSLKQLQRLTTDLRKISNMLTKALCEQPVLEAAVEAISPCLASTEHSELLHLSMEHLMAAMHNLLLFSTESSTQLRKHVTKTKFFEGLLLPYVNTLLASNMADARNSFRMKMVLKTLVILTCKIAVFRQTLLADNFTPKAIEAGDLETFQLLARLNCNLEIIQSMKQSQKHAELATQVQNCFTRRWSSMGDSERKKARRRFQLNDPVLPITRNTTTFTWFEELFQSENVADAVGEQAEPEVDVPDPQASQAPSENPSKAKRKRNRKKKYGWQAAAAQQLAAELLQNEAATEQADEGEWNVVATKGKRRNKRSLSRNASGSGLPAAASVECGDPGPAQATEEPAEGGWWQDRDEDEEVPEDEDSDLDMDAMQKEIEELRSRLSNVASVADSRLKELHGET